MTERIARPKILSQDNIDRARRTDKLRLMILAKGYGSAQLSAATGIKAYTINKIMNGFDLISDKALTEIEKLVSALPSVDPRKHG